jgi:hypothetical protein
MWPQLIPVLGNLFDRLFPDPKVAADAKLEVMKLAQTGELAQLNADLQLATGQMEVNKVEAASSDKFTSRARPFIMWICGFSLMYAALVEPFARFIAVVWFHYSGAFPVINTDITLQLLFGLLGLGAYRTVEKVRGVAK